MHVLHQFYKVSTILLIEIKPASPAQHYCAFGFGFFDSSLRIETL
jgi:hypothetical protein